MIRLASMSDIDQINEIGLLIKEDFKYIYRIDESLKNSYENIYLYEEDNIIKGFLHIENHFEITDIINIAVKEESHHQGIGFKLLSFLIENTDSNKIMLEVKESNLKAIDLYQKCGFKEIYRRIKYYGNEDAIIMERVI